MNKFYVSVSRDGIYLGLLCSDGSLTICFDSAILFDSFSEAQTFVDQLKFHDEDYNSDPGFRFDILCDQ